jgi:hypothetical protein
MSTSRLKQGMARMNLRGGLGAVLGQALFPLPAEVERETDPDTLRKLRNASMMQMGLGMMTASGKGASTGAGLGYGLQQGQEALQGGLGQIVGVRRMNREDKRLDLAEERNWIADERTAAYMDRQAATDAQRVKERGEDVKYRNEQALRMELRAAADDARMLDDSNLRREVLRDGQKRQYWAERLGGSIAKLRGLGVEDDDPLVASLLTQLDVLGVDARTPKSGIGLDPSRYKSPAAPDLSGLIND